MKRFSIVQNGYDIDEVNRFIDIVIRRLEKLDNENKSSLKEIEILNNKLKEKDTTPNIDISKTLQTLEEVSNKVRSNAKEEARLIVEEARKNANAIINEALIEAARTENEASLLKKNITVYKNRVKNILKSQLEIAEELDKVEL